MKRLIVILFFLSPFFLLKGQVKPAMTDSLLRKYTLLKTATYNGQTYPQIEMKEIKVYAKGKRKNRFDYRKYSRLVYNVKKAYPYALIVRKEMVRVNAILGSMSSEKERKTYLQKYEKDIFSQYKSELSKFSISQAKILIKLIDRETQATSYQLITDYRGKLSATFWQGIAKICGTNLKSHYDPDGDDYLIELIIKDIEAGIL